MLEDKNRIFQNLYNDLGSDLTSAQKRGDWKDTKEIISKGREWIINEIKSSELRGRGGAGFPTGKKWEIVSNYDGKKYVAVNGDEGEPGTFKDRLYLENDPHRTLEGMLIAAWAVDADDCYFYLRDEYPEIRHILEEEMYLCLK